ncbi:hypothetical protein PGT21_009293 [Puccinia graminis f. sp. tritici]|uniref:Uncharacterized protein n=1 Tax=Puccinia graminis f. sp. tritici TaxID=56615 RepID=A0A5B0MN58_PUCGR|nr:hypothetical protein PGT21_009293 [Puccinia graminis f. sp. tritici]
MCELREGQNNKESSSELRDDCLTHNKILAYLIDLLIRKRNKIPTQFLSTAGFLDYSLLVLEGRGRSTPANQHTRRSKIDPIQGFQHDSYPPRASWTILSWSSRVAVVPLQPTNTLDDQLLTRFKDSDTIPIAAGLLEYSFLVLEGCGRSTQADQHTRQLMINPIQLHLIS